MGKKAVVVGATGLVGRALTEQLANAGHVNEVITLTRSPVEHSSSKIQNQVVDFDRLSDFGSLFKADILFSCLGTTRKQAGSAAAQRQVDVDYQYKAAQLASKQGVGHYLLVSSSGANADSRTSYLQMKGQLEQCVLALPFRRISIFQPSLLLGHRTDFRLGEKLGAWVLPALCLLPGLHRYRPISGDQVAAKMIQVTQQPGPSVEHFTLDEIFVDLAS